MNKVWTKLLIAMIAVFAVSATPAYAQPTRTWVSGVGDDANPCSRTAPCRTFAGALSKTVASGEINCLDSGGFGGVTITKAIAIKCAGVVGGVIVAQTNGITINAGTTDKVVIEGLDIEGLSSLGGGSFNGINIIQARDVLVRNTTIRGFTEASTGNGILVNTTTAVRVVLDNTSIFNNRTGVAVKSTAGPGASARVFNSVFYANSVAGVATDGAINSVYLSNVRMTGSPKAASNLNGGVTYTYGNNVLNTGSTDPLTPIALQ